MNFLFMMLALIGVGGIAGLLLARQFTFMKLVVISLISVGCVGGLFFTLSRLTVGPVEMFASWHWLHFLTLSFQLDSISLFFLLPIFLISPLSLIYSFHYLDNHEKKIRVGVNYFFFAVLVVAMALVVMAANMVSFLLAWEMMSLSSFFLVLYDYQVKVNRKAAYLYFIFAQGGAMFVFAAFGLIYNYSSSFAFSSFIAIPDKVKLLVFILSFIGFGSKAGIFPLHIWLPKAHPVAPSHISAIMSGVMIKMGLYGIFRIYLLLAPTTPVVGQFVLVIGIVTGVVGVVYALAMQDIKELLAYSSVENVGIIMIGLGLGMVGVSESNQALAFFGFAGALLHVFNHSIFKPLLFMGAGAVLHSVKTKNIEELGGLMKRMPITGRTFLAGSLAISGLPPFSGFIGEFLIYYGAFQGLSSQRLSFIMVLLAIVSLAVIGGLAAACFSKVVGLAFLGEPRSQVATQAEETGTSMLLVMLGLAGTTLLIGILPEPFIRLAFLGIKDVAVIADFDSVSFMTIVRHLSKAIVIFASIVIMVSFLRKIVSRKKEIGKAPTWGCGFSQITPRMQYTSTSYAAEMIAFYRPFVPVKTVFSGIRKIFPGPTTWQTEVKDLAEINYQKWLIKPMMAFLHKLRWIQHGNIQLYIGYIMVAIIGLLLFLYF